MMVFQLQFSGSRQQKHDLRGRCRLRDGDSYCLAINGLSDMGVLSGRCVGLMCATVFYCQPNGGNELHGLQVLIKIVDTGAYTQEVHQVSNGYNGYLLVNANFYKRQWIGSQEFLISFCLGFWTGKL